ncbi:hypothetical protein [Aquipseudomonas alcaligenes]|uniref:hypothetical protein n=1 Tax=Aquipseudomonas alcaligenes TaxID=43263 RepID=UPI00077FF672|nr:hypothetical protein [Pseudomonas alcaligenes]AMR65687.1 hypothetical protein A0T30_04590 [Pseudomonas alcaligenes]
MSSFNDQNIEQGVRKRTEYENAQRARLVLNIDRKDGGKLQLPLLLDARITEEEVNVQQNTLLAVMPLARLPGYDSVTESPRGALPRPGRIYVFQKNKLWRELECDGRGQLSEVDVAHWRKLAGQGGEADQRPPVGKTQYLIILPMFLQGRDVANDIYMAYSEIPWTWEYIQWLEASSGRVQSRCQNVRPAWAAAVVDAKQWKPTQSVPALPISNIRKGLRARELHVETLLEDPALFTPEMKELPSNAPIRQLERYKKELAGHLKIESPSPLPELPTGTDLLDEYKLRPYPRLVGLILDDPLFALRHAIAQARLDMELLHIQNALIPHQPYGRYAELLYQHALPPQGALAEFQRHINVPALKKASLHDERRSVRNRLYRVQNRVVELANGRLSGVFNDFLHAHDERLLEPYALISEIQQTLRSPVASDTHCIEPEDRQTASRTLQLAVQLAEGKHRLSQGLLPKTPEQRPSTVTRLDKLKNSRTAVKPERTGLSSMNFFGQAYAAQNMLLGLDELFGDFIRSSALVLKSVEQSEKLIQIKLDKLFAPSFNLLKQMHSQAAGLQLISQGQALGQDMVVLGAHGGGLSFGLSLSERQTLTRENYVYANVHGKDERTIATTSGKQANRLNLARHNLGQVTVVAAPANDPVVAQFAKIRRIAPHLGRLETIGTTPVLPTLAAACAVFNLYANTVGAASLKETERHRYRFGAASAVSDLALASNTTALRILEGFGKTENFWYRSWEMTGFDVSKLSPRWADILAKRTGSSLLSVSRMANFSGMALTAGLFVWDGYRSYRDGEDDLALAYGGMAFAGAATWALYGIGLLGGPLVLAAGLGLFIGGLVAAALLADGPAEQAVKHGPFGSKQRLPQMNDPRLAYQQLLGALAQPQIQIASLSGWFANAAKADRQALQEAAAQLRVKLDPQDWIVELQSPLLSQYPAGQDFTLRAWERRADRTNSTAWNYHRPAREIRQQKLGPLILDGTRMLFVLPRQYSPEQDRQNVFYGFRYALRVCAQVRLSEHQCLASDADGYKELVLPQPAPRSWTPYVSGPVPQSHQTEGDTPYWRIEQSDYQDS